MINSFEENGFVIAKEFIDLGTIKIISQYMENKITRKEWNPIGDDCTKFAMYADPLMEVILPLKLSHVEEICKKSLLPTYSYSRIYQESEELKPHTDREACEVSVTVNIASKNGISPIYMQYKKNQPVEVVLNPGDAVVYKGCEAKHWRSPLDKGQLNVQFMLHYVDKHGINAEHKFDKRQNLGFPGNHKGL